MHCCTMARVRSRQFEKNVYRNLRLLVLYWYCRNFDNFIKAYSGVVIIDSLRRLFCAKERTEYMQNLEDTLLQNSEYKNFVEKFKPKNPTDECYTPSEVYAVVEKYVYDNYGIKHENIVRPFYPGGDYENYDYKGTDVVVDNPPFSILSQICDFYIDRKIPFFLFAPELTMFSYKKAMEINHIICDGKITYHNGANVKTAFVTNLDDGIVLQTDPDLGRDITATMRHVSKPNPKYSYPKWLITPSIANRYVRRGVKFKIKSSECVRIRALDAQKEYKKAIFGGGLLLGESALKKIDTAKRITIKSVCEPDEIVWELSEREKEIIKSIN